ncbi:MAG: hypothetical protein WA058_02005 [Minisyncoccia bacterium]
MKHSRLWILAGIIALIIVGGFILSVPRTRDIESPESPSVAATVPAVTLRDSFKKGVHTITGSLMAPNACATASAEASLQGESGILIAVSLPEDSDICLEVPTRTTFTTTISAPARLPITATVNGETATTTVS